MFWLFVACSGGGTAPAERARVDHAALMATPKRTQSGKYLVSVAFSPEPPVMGELFEARATVTHADGTPVEVAQVTLDARMPQHGHGMETRPIADPGVCAPADVVDDEDAPATAAQDDAAPAEVCRHAGGVFLSRGFKFHMGGEWTVMVDVDGPVGRDSTTFVYEMR